MLYTQHYTWPLHTHDSIAAAAAASGAHYSRLNDVCGSPMARVTGAPSLCRHVDMPRDSAIALYAECRRPACRFRQQAATRATRCCAPALARCAATSVAATSHAARAARRRASRAATATDSLLPCCSRRQQSRRATLARHARDAHAYATSSASDALSRRRWHATPSLGCCQRHAVAQLAASMAIKAVIIYPLLPLIRQLNTAPCRRRALLRRLSAFKMFFADTLSAAYARTVLSRQRHY